MHNSDACLQPHARLGGEPCALHPNPPHAQSGPLKYACFGTSRDPVNAAGFNLMMQFVVFAAFAIALSVPEAGPSWARVTSPGWTWAAVIGQVVLAGAAGAVCTRLVKVKLEREPAWLPGAQKRLARANVAMRLIVLVGIAASVYLTGWVKLVRSWELIQPIWGLDELLILVPFFAAIVVSWAALYPADRAVRRVGLELRLWGAHAARPVWGLRAYLSFMLRQHVLIIAVPMVPIVAANDFTHVYARQIRAVAHNIAWADQALLVLIAGLVFLMAPVMLSYIWHTRALPPGELRGRLEGLCAQIGLRYRRILIWESDGMVVNAAVMGMFPRVRYILLSDGLLEMMDDDKIEAVFGHEAGHVKHWHIQFYLLFAVLSMLIVGGIMELAMWAMRRWPTLLSPVPDVQDYLQVGAMALIVMIWALGFGAISRRFEWQADLFGARSVTPPAEVCDQPCFVHGTPLNPSPARGRRGNPICSTAATRFANALHRIAVLNGIPVEARSWRHSSIANRMQLLKQYGYDPAAVGQLERSVFAIKLVLVIGTLVGLAIAVWLYWP